MPSRRAEQDREDQDDKRDTLWAGWRPPRSRRPRPPRSATTWWRSSSQGAGLLAPGDFRQHEPARRRCRWRARSGRGPEMFVSAVFSGPCRSGCSGPVSDAGDPSCRPFSANPRPSVTTNDGTPTYVTQRADRLPIAAPIRMASGTATHGDTPYSTMIFAMKTEVTPLIAATERSIP